MLKHAMFELHHHQHIDIPRLDGVEIEDDDDGDLDVDAAGKSEEPEEEDEEEEGNNEKKTMAYHTLHWRESLPQNELYKLQLARAFVVNPEVLVLHRPLKEYNEETAVQMMKVIKWHVE